MTLASREFDHPGLSPLVIDLIPDQTRAEIEATIDAPLTIERGPSAWESENETVPVAATEGA
jgi:hypothetical protein